MATSSLQAPEQMRGVSRRGILLGTAALTAAFALSACSGHDSTADTGLPRVVALGYIKDADAALAAGIAPVGMPKPSGLSDSEPWTLAAIGALGQGKPEHLEVGAEAPLERIAALKPDLILATGFYAIDKYKDQLEQITKVLLPESGPSTDPWRETAKRVGKALERDSTSLEEIATTEAAISQAACRYPQLQGKTFTYSSYRDGIFSTKIDPDDVIAQELAAYGMSISPAVIQIPPAQTAGFAEVSSEEVTLLDADITIILATSEEKRKAIEAVPLFGRLDSVRRGSYIPIGAVDGNSLAFPSVLSVRHAASNVVPQLAAAVR